AWFNPARGRSLRGHPGLRRSQTGVESLAGTLWLAAVHLCGWGIRGGLDPLGPQFDSWSGRSHGSGQAERSGPASFRRVTKTVDRGADARVALEVSPP